MKTTQEILDTIQSYLGNGGLFNPEMMEHEKVRNLIMDCKELLTSNLTLKGGRILTPSEMVSALDEAMQIIEAVGTTGIYSRYRRAHDWMNCYYPAWA